MNEMMIMNENSMILLKNDELNTATQKINELGVGMKVNAFQIAKILADVDAKPEILTDDGFVNTADWGMKMFGFKKSQIYDWIRVGQQFAEMGGYNMTQLQLMSNKALTDDDRKNITPETTCDEIRDIIKAKKGDKKVDNKKDTPKKVEFENDRERILHSYTSNDYQKYLDKKVNEFMQKIDDEFTSLSEGSPEVVSKYILAHANFYRQLVIKNLERYNFLLSQFKADELTDDMKLDLDIIKPFIDSMIYLPEEVDNTDDNTNN